MVKVILTAEGDDEGNIWLDAEAPIRLRREDTPPHRIAIGGQLSGVSGVHFRLTRPDAYRLIDQLELALETDTQNGAERVAKRTKLAVPLNGGVHSETGEMVLTFRGASGLDHHFLLPFDQSGAMLEIVERAAKTASEWHDARLTPELNSIQKVEIQPRETESVMLADDPATGRTILVVRLTLKPELARTLTKDLRLSNSALCEMRAVAQRKMNSHP